MNMEALEAISRLDRAYITAAEAAAVLGCDPQYIRMAAHQDPAQLGFPVMCVGNRTKILRLPFIKFVTGGGWKENAQ